MPKKSSQPPSFNQRNQSSSEFRPPSVELRFIFLCVNQIIRNSNCSISDLIVERRFFLRSAMAAVSHEATSICTHCDRPIPAANIDLHYAHCSRKLEKCKVCGDMVPKKNAEDHYLSTHAPVTCSMCSETMDRDILDIHTGENCPQRIVTCEFCEFPLPAIDLAEHQEVCGNRTELCHLCNRYVRLRERYNHEAGCNGIPNITVGSSRDVRAAEREGGARRRQQDNFSKRRLLFTIAITGIAVLFGSLFFQRKTEHNDVH